VIVPKCGGGDDTAELDRGILEEKIEGVTGRCILIVRGNYYMPVSIIYLKDTIDL
jgi:hypothetical protein